MSYRAYIISESGSVYVRTLRATSATQAESRIYRKCPRAVLVTIIRLGA